MKHSAAAARVEDFVQQAEAHFDGPDHPGKPKIFMPSVPGAFNAIGPGSNHSIEYESEEEAFPPVAPGLKPTGNLLLVMLRQPKAMSSGGIHFETEVRKTERDNMQVAKVIAMGPLAFHSRDTMKPWPEGSWCSVGSYVRVPKYQGDYFAKPFQRKHVEIDQFTDKRTESTVTDHCTFAFFKDLAITAVYDTLEEALSVRAFL